MIVCCGEALIDFLPRNGADGASVFQPFVGGSVFNVAVAIGRLGAPAGYYGGLSTDFFGTMLREALAESGVDLSLVNISDRPSTLAFVTLVDGDARYAFFDEHSAGRMLTEDDLPALPTDGHGAPFRLVQPGGGALRIGLRGAYAARKPRSRHLARPQHPADASSRTATATRPASCG